MDILTPEKRSWNMSRIRSRDTRPEIALRSALHRLGYRFRLVDNKLPGRPDIVLPKYKTAVFVQGCFWHRHRGCKFSYTPKSRIAFWQNKFEENIDRDKRNIEEVSKRGWLPIVIWECEIKNDLDRIIHLLTTRLHLSAGAECKSEHTRGAA